MTCLKHVTLKHGNVNSGGISGCHLCLEFVINQHFSRYCCLYRKWMRDQSKTFSSWSVNSFDFSLAKAALVMKGSCNFSRKKSNELTDIPDMFYYRTSMLLGNHKRQRRPCSWSNITNLQQKTTRWRHQMETFSALLTLCAGNSPVTGEFSAQRPITRSFDVFFDLRMNKRLGKQSWGWWFETPSRSLWRHCNAYCCK